MHPKDAAKENCQNQLLEERNGEETCIKSASIS